MLEGKILITGGSGYLARAIYRMARRENWNTEFTSMSRNEDQQSRMKKMFPEVRCVLGDVRSLGRVTDLAYGHNVIIHAAALKRVPESEIEVLETIATNIGGSINVAMAARTAGVETVVGISTDKSVEPVNLYGCTKMAMERIFGEANNWGDTRYVVTRYGNVVGSTGSIVPVFREMLKQHAVVRVTDPEMTRFWLSPDDAVDLVTLCVEHAEALAGDILVPFPGAMKIGDLARTITGDDLDLIEIVGPRPGEKKHEALVSPYEAARSQIVTLDGDISAIISATGKETVGWDSPMRPMDNGYTSDEPRHWISQSEMLSMIEDAAYV